MRRAHLLVIGLSAFGLGLGATAPRNADARPGAPAVLADFADSAGVWTYSGPWIQGPHSAYDACVYDAVHDRLVVYTGAGAGDTWTCALGDTFAWSGLSTVGEPPARQQPGYAYDSTRNRLLVFGGLSSDGSGARSDVWALSLDETPTWTEIIAVGAPPPGRFDLGMAYDPVRDQIVVSGGTSGSVFSGLLADTWTLPLGTTGATWQQWTSAAPFGARVGVHLLYDPVRDRVLQYGGFDGAFTDGDVWSLALTGGHAWTRVTTQGTYPANRYDGAVAYDPLSDKMWLFYGRPQWSGAIQDISYLDLTQSTPMWGTTTPVNDSRYGNSAVWDPMRSVFVLYGGIAYGTPDVIQYYHTVDGMLEPPITRQGAAAVYDSLGDRVLMLMGAQATNAVNEVWALSMSTLTWTPVYASGTPPAVRSYPSAIFDPIRNRVVLYGGRAPSSITLNDVWALTLSPAPAWQLLLPSGGLLSRAAHTAVYDRLQDRMIVFGGGYSGSGFGWHYQDDVWALPLGGGRGWTQLSPLDVGPARRSDQVGVYDPDHNRLVIYGGKGAAGNLTDTWAFDLAAGGGWAQLAAGGGVPDTDYQMVAAYDPDFHRMIAGFGSSSGSFSSSSAMWELPLADQAPANWFALAPAGTPPGYRNGAAAAWDSRRHRLVVIDGIDVGTGNRVRDQWTLTFSPTVTAVSGPPVRTGLGLDVRPAGRRAVTLEARVPAGLEATLDVWSADGRLTRHLASQQLEPGTHAIRWDGTGSDGRDVAAGVYFARLAAGPFAAHARIVVPR